MRRILALTAFVVSANARAETFRIPRPLPTVLDAPAAEATARVGEGSRSVTGEKAREACADTCSEVLVWGGGTASGSTATVESAFLFVSEGRVRSARWVFAGETGKPEKYPRFEELFTTLPKPDDVLVVSKGELIEAHGVSDSYVRDLMWNVDGHVWTAMVLCPVVPETGDGPARPSTFREWRVVQMKAGGTPLWKAAPRLPGRRWSRDQIEHLLGKPAAILTGDRVKAHCTGCDSVSVWGPAGLPSASFSNITVYAYFKGDTLVGARWTCQPVSLDAPDALPRIGQILADLPKDEAVGTRGRWTMRGAEYVADLDCDKKLVWSEGKGLYAVAASLSRCRVRDVSWTPSGDPPPDPESVAAEILRDLSPDVRDIGITPVTIHQPAPVYPAKARKARLTATVVLAIVVNHKGVIEEIEVIEGDSGPFTKAAIEAVSKWRYQQIVVNGEPIRWKSRVTLKFRLR